jgi:hypothetical protein
VDQFPFSAAIANACMAVTPSDTTVLPRTTVMLRIGGAGNIVFQLWGQDSEQPALRAVSAGDEIRDLQIKRVMSTNTTATLIEAYYVVKKVDGS